ncbi:MULTISPECIES: major tail protein [Bacillus]|uniref:major tail protein n=1 Tax=Bacillus TaxID=1386 RepID=UPI00069FB778|nr:major tail protein [Bacillus glycinifermentans]MEC0497244.1 phage tail protein [Bacillus glycinifermentans]MEC0540763.1 phage tail protein [Bacillus glycinifermentans]
MGSVSVGLENLVYAKLIKDEKGDIQYGEVKDFAPVISAKVDTATETGTLYANNGPIIAKSQIGETKVSLGVSEIPMEVLADITGQKLVKGVIVYKQDAVPPYVALGFTGTKEDGNKRMVWLTKGRFGLPSEDRKTSEDKVDFQTDEIEGTFIQRSDKVFKIVGDSGVAGFEEFESTFFDQVFDVKKLEESGSTPTTDTTGGAA